MKIGLIDVDGHNFPNLALMKISAWHKSQGDTVEWCLPLDHYDIVYQSKVFDETYSHDIEWIPMADKVIKGGTGYGLDNTLPDEIEHIYPDYSIYFNDNDLIYDEESGECLGLHPREKSKRDTAYGFLTRGCPRGCKFCIVAEKEGRRSYKVADLNEFWRGQKYIELLDPNILACREHPDLLQQLVESKAWVNFNQGLDIRLVTSENIELLNRIKVKEIHFAWDNPKDDLRPYFAKYKLLAKHKPHGSYGMVYCLTNFGSTLEEDCARIYALRELGYDPYVMIYDKPNAPKEIRYLQRWCNNKIIFNSCPRFEDYDFKKG